MDQANTATDPDRGLVARAAKGDADAASQLYRRHERRAYNLALRMLGDPWDAADVTQEAFIKAFGSLRQFKGEARFSTWLHRIVVNAVYDQLRRRRPEPVPDEVMDRLSASGEDRGGGSGPGGGDISTSACEGALSPTMREALMSLGDGFRLAVVLCDLLDFTYGEAAEILEVREGTIKSRLFRARAALAEKLLQNSALGRESPLEAAGEPAGEPAGESGNQRLSAAVRGRVDPDDAVTAEITKPSQVEGIAEEESSRR